MFTKQELAERLNGRFYLSEMTKDEEQEAKESGLVVVYGQSDDLVELRGAINDELDMYDGGTIYLNHDGVIKNECEDEDCPYFQKQLEDATQILAVWGDDHPSLGVQGYSWSFRSVDIPDANMFDIFDKDGEKYCRGFIFSMEEIKQ